MTKRKSKFSGLLATPLPAPRFAEVFGRGADEQFKALLREKIALLFAHYGIDAAHAAAWQILAIRLAQDYVPGFKREQLFRKKAGRPEKWTTGMAMQLQADVRALVLKGYSELESCRILVQQSNKGAGVRPETLLRRFKLVQAEHKKSGWSDDQVLAWVNLTRDPAAMEALKAAGEAPIATARAETKS